MAFNAFPIPSARATIARIEGLAEAIAAVEAGATGPAGPPGPAGAAGAAGATGATGAAGAAGAAGQGVPTGGTTGQVLAKTSGTNYATAWTDPSGGVPTSRTLTFNGGAAQDLSANRSFTVEPTLMRQRIEKLKRNAYIASTMNPRASAEAGTAVCTITGSGSATSGNTRVYSPYTTHPTLRSSWEWDLCGGFPVTSGNGLLKAWSTTGRTGGGGNIGDGTDRQLLSQRIYLDTDAAVLDIQALGSSTLYKFLVDNKDGEGFRYISKTASYCQTGGGYGWFHLSFTDGKQPKGRIVCIEMAFSAGVLEFRVAPDEFIRKPVGEMVRMAVVGDSLTTGTGAAWAGNSWAQVLADYLGVKDCRQVAIGGTGYVNPVTPSGTQWPYISHVSDVTSIPDLDLIVCSGGNNDTDQTGSVQAAAIAYIAALRAGQPDTPIVVLGPDSFTTPTTNVLTVETALAAAVASFNVSNIQFIPLCVLANGGGSELFGTGNVVTPTGDGNADRYTGSTVGGSDAVHPDDVGHDFRGAGRAPLIRESYFRMGA